MNSSLERQAREDMSEWFQERYISRDEHQRIVDYYRRLVAQLYGKLRESRSELDAQTLDKLVAHSRRKAEREMRRLAQGSPSELGGNVIRVDFRRGA